MKERGSTKKKITEEIHKGKKMIKEGKTKKRIKKEAWRKEKRKKWSNKR